MLSCYRPGSLRARRGRGASRPQDPWRAHPMQAQRFWVLRRWHWMALWVCAALGGACTSVPETRLGLGAAEPAQVEIRDHWVVKRIPFPTAPRCAGAFVRHSLDNVSLRASDQGVRMFDSNGSGVALGDLNGDRLLDIAFANLSEPNAILWNRGGLRFERMNLAPGASRAAAIVDVDGDEALDVVFTQRLDPPVVYLNQANAAQRGVRAFSQAAIPGLAKTAYSMAWSDLDRDGDLDAVTGSYDLELQMLLGEAFEGQTASGLYWHENRGFWFRSQLLARRSQALALTVLDDPRAARSWLAAGNDFLLPDNHWARGDDGLWTAHAPFAVTTQNTMGFSWGDVNNDGRLDLYAADMKPRVQDAATLRAWQPVMNKVLEDPADRQITENVLQVQDAGQRFANRAQAYGVEATGWTWSAQLADFDQDGFLDLYVVNGMKAVDLFSHLPDHELVETNWAFRNRRGEFFEPAPEWNLGLRQGGRGMSVGDLDLDGDLDIVINHLQASAVLLENQLCQGASIQVRLRDRQTPNTHGIGARIRLLHAGGTQVRVMEATSGYLSGLPAVAHFGFPDGSGLRQLEITWPDGESVVIRDVQPGHLHEVMRLRPAL